MKPQRLIQFFMIGGIVACVLFVFISHVYIIKYGYVNWTAKKGTAYILLINSFFFLVYAFGHFVIFIRKLARRDAKKEYLAEKNI